MKLLQTLAAAGVLLLAGCHDTPFHPSNWQAKVPAADRQQRNPLPATPANLDAGSAQYRLYCAGCHASDALGRRSKPGLRNARVRGETDGELFWILWNGSKGHGMPAWRSLGTDSVWQLVEYIRSLPPGD